jgi:hypothetical protein
VDYITVAKEVFSKDIARYNFSLSPSMYRRVEIPNSNTKPVEDLLDGYIKGEEVGSLAYVKHSPYHFIRTKALQSYSNLLTFKGDSTLTVHPKKFVGL